ncbi:tyrosine-type recombinase/integrase [uncultured Marixanthomonas sp.]|uniref:tyrosine-type recombinase/integrase n=1 Tax=uncultured Marixanthomonas sp. TaxID=757245 RepID=UPI0030DAABDF|tara:strand:+ start:95915 stop:97087 length:1173 start_codon:yes stop_codon:yes gene_type:complete
MSTPSVNPKNWKSGGAKLLKKNWQIQYYFYPKNSKKPKLVALKGMNHIKNLKGRRFLTENLIEDEIDNNKMGYNPIEKKYIHPADENTDLHPYLDFISAFRLAVTKIQCSEKHRKQMGWCIDRLEKKVVRLRLQRVIISDLKRRQLKQLLEACNLPDNYYNKFLSFLSRIFGELVEYECCETNLVRDIRKRKITKTQRDILSSEDHKAIMKYLKANHYEFWRYARIFLFSGARTTELFRVQVKDVNIEKQEYHTTILKGNQPKEVTKVILQDVIPLWEEVIKGAKPDDYIFSRGLKHGKKSIRPYQITRRWLRLVKKSDKIKNLNGNTINVTADFYSLKHSFLDSLPLDVARQIASHTNSKTTELYRVNSEKRKREQLKNLNLENNDFSN